MKRTAVFCTIVLLSLLSEVRASDMQLRISVSATVPPRPCLFPAVCRQAPTTLSQVTISDAGVFYVGWQPQVVTVGGFLIVRF